MFWMKLNLGIFLVCSSGSSRALWDHKETFVLFSLTKVFIIYVCPASNMSHWLKCFLSIRRIHPISIVVVVLLQQLLLGNQLPSLQLPPVPAATFLQFNPLRPIRPRHSLCPRHPTQTTPVTPTISIISDMSQKAVRSGEWYCEKNDGRVCCFSDGTFAFQYLQF